MENNINNKEQQVHIKLKKLKRAQFALDIILVVALFIVLNLLISAIAG